MREYQGVEYYNCDDFTEEEMQAIHTMDPELRSVRERLFKRCGWNRDKELYQRDMA